MPLASAAAQTAATDTATKIVFGGFVDSYFAYDFNHPRDLDRRFTTQAARHDEFNINLAFLDVVLTGPRLRGRFAAQFGTSVQANYAAEPRLGTLSGPDVSRYIQEATFGYQISRQLWIDGGVFFSPFGSESWISRDNWTYTRSFIADNSPYYEAGVKATWQATPTVSAQLHLINGWQNISETNSDKALGARVDYTPHDGYDFAYDAFVGNEQPDSLPSQLRVWQEGIAQFKATSRVELRATLDYGFQRRPRNTGTATWWGWAAIARYHVAPTVAMAVRGQQYSDPEQIIVTTNQPFGLHANGVSLNVDVSPAARLLWRTEMDVLWSPHALFARGAGGLTSLSSHDAYVVTSVALTF
jgi:hypothetical protein